MSEYRRCYVPAGSYFFTVVAERRSPLFANRSAQTLLGHVMRSCFQRYPLDVAAIVLLPDHIHTIWTLPSGDDAYSLRWRWIKREFTRKWLAMGGTEKGRSSSRIQQRRRGVWQRRFWEHTIRDERDFEKHFDYIHYNPVKHGLVKRPRDWQWSSFHQWVKHGHYSVNWGAGSCPPLVPEDIGE